MISDVENNGVSNTYEDNMNIGRERRQNHRGKNNEHHRDGHYHHHEEHETDMDDLGSLMRACGHFLYHSGGERNGQVRILRILSKSESISQKELQEILAIQPGSISEILSKMENRGLIKRERDEVDKRKIIVSITESGKNSLNNGEKNRHNQDKFAVLTEEQKEELKKMLGMLLDSWK